MRLQLNKFAFEYNSALPAFNTTNDELKLIYGAISALEFELDVDTSHFPENAFNTHLPVHQRPKLIEYLRSAYLPNLNIHLSDEKISKMVDGLCVETIPSDWVGKIINDQRHFFKQCELTGDLIHVLDAENYIHADKLKNISITDDTLRIWRLESLSCGTKFELEFKDLGGVLGIDESLTYINYKGENAKHRFNDDPVKLAKNF